MKYILSTILLSVLIIGLYAQDAEIDSSSYMSGEKMLRQSKYDSARYFYNLALKQANSLQNEGMAALIRGSIGNSYMEQGRLVEAKPYFDKVLEYARSSADSIQIMKSLGYLGVYYSNKGDYKRSAEMTFEAMEIAENLGLRRRQSILLTNLCVLYGRMKDYENALIYQRASLIIDHELDDEEGLAYGYNNMGNVHRRMGLRDSALYYYEKAKEYHQSRGNMGKLAGLYTNIGVYHMGDRKYDAALENFERAFQIADSMSLMYKKVLILINIAWAYEEKGLFVKSEKYYLQSLELSIDHNYTRHQQDISKHIAVLYDKMGRYEEAYEYQEDFIALKDSILTEQNQRAISELRTKYETEKVERENEILTQESEIHSLELRRQQTRFWSLLGGIVLLLMLLFLAFVGYRLRQKNIKTQLEKQSLEYERTMLRSQMNPHFIFNSMNSIQSYISGNDSFTAMTYLSKFAHLMRGILENSRSQMITLEDEINTLKLYTELEGLRFQNKFKTELLVDPKIEQDCTFVPPMLIQPFVENAIKHGLKTKEGDGLLIIQFKQTKDCLRCTVEDNGIGREATAGDKHKDDNHRSLGMQLTKERMQALSHELGLVFDFIISDLVDDSGKASGTRVEIRIPFEVE